MKFQPDRLEGTNVITSQSPELVAVNGQPWRQSLLVPWRGEVLDWSGARVGEVSADHFAHLLALRPEVVIFGSGPSIRFPTAAVLRPLIDARIGCETMDTAAACRTYNVLAAEGRQVVAALLLG